MKPFNLEEAKAGKPVCTRDGRPVRIICFDRKQYGSDLDDVIIALALNKGGDEEVIQYKKNGMYQGTKSRLDLMMVGEKKEGWINIYIDQIDENGEYNTPMGYACGDIYESKEEAEQKEGMAYKNALMATIKIEWEE